jgi:hypothetical protein
MNDDITRRNRTQKCTYARPCEDAEDAAIYKTKREPLRRN